MLFSYLSLFLFWATLAVCNTEKAIFLAPERIQIPTSHPTLDDLHIDSLTTLSPAIRTHLHADFPTDTQRKGLATWLLLENLQEGQRYEVRVCWAATQPTAFRLEVHELQSVFGDPGLVTSLAEYSAARQRDAQADTQASKELRKPTAKEEQSSTLFLQILAAADYYTMNQTLMKHVPPVHVDIILDPYLFNIFPQSLVPTAIYLTIIAVGAWFLSKIISLWLLNVRGQNIDAEKKRS